MNALTPVAAALVWGSAQLRAAGTPSPNPEARTLLATALQTSPGELVLLPGVDAEALARFEGHVHRRIAGEPMQHIAGVAGFRTVDVAVGPGVFVPRPETEVMVGWALEVLADRTDPIVVELCAGSGAISKALVTEDPRLQIHAVELSEQAFDYARRNLEGTSVELLCGDMADAFGALDGTIDLVIANPPYIPLEAWESVTAEVRDHDPTMALFSGVDGLDGTRVVAGVAARLLRSGGVVCSEHAEVQEGSAQQVFLDSGWFEQVRSHRDLADRPRFVSARRMDLWQYDIRERG